MRFLLLTMLVPCALTAQIAPDTPRLVSPHGSGGFGVLWVRSGVLPRDDEALLVTLAAPGIREGLRLRGGIGLGADSGYAVHGGIDLQGPMLRRVAGSSLDMDWQGGLGASIGDFAVITLPIGLTASLSRASGDVWISPYVTAGIAAELRAGAEAPPRTFEVSPTIDLGLDLAFDRQRRFLIRSAVSLGDRQAVAIGFALGAGRRDD